MIRIADATFDDLCYIGSWLSAVDRMELAVTRDPDDYPSLARDAFASMIHKVALDHAGTPIFAFGAYPIRKGIAHVWGFKTRDGPKAIRTVTKYLLKELIPDLREAGVVRAVCYVHEENHGSRKWLAYLGFRPDATHGEIGAPLMKYQRDELSREHPDFPS
jgi:hypothetical protein